MGWEKRDKHQYYYRKVRTGQRVVSQYVGNDAQAIEREQQALREQQRHALRQALLEQMKLEDAVADIDHLVSAIVTGAYLAAGYYCHHRGMAEGAPATRACARQGKAHLPCEDDNGGVRAEMSEKTEREIFEALIARTNQAHPSAEDVEQLRQMLKGNGSLLPSAGSLAKQSQQVLLNSIKLSAAAREVIMANLSRLQEALERDGTSPLEKLLTENILLCSLRYYLWECAYHVHMANSNDPRAAKEWEVMLNQAQKRYLRAVETLARVRRLNIAVQVNIATDGGQQVNVMGLTQKKNAEG